MSMDTEASGPAAAGGEAGSEFDGGGDEGASEGLGDEPADGGTAPDATEADQDPVRRLDERATAGREASRSAVAALGDVESQVDEIVERARILDDQGGEVVEVGQRGRESAEAILREIEELVEYRDEVETYVEQLVTGMEEIRDVAAVIEDVADRTNILAMNAAIEAARAGEGGSGFGVVADEVKDLAEQTGKRVEEIDETIDRMSEASGGSVVALEELDEGLDSSAEVAEDAFEAIDSVAETVEEAAAEIGTIADVAERGAEMTREAASEVETAASASAEVADLTDEVFNDGDGVDGGTPAGAEPAEGEPDGDADAD